MSIDLGPVGRPCAAYRPGRGDRECVEPAQFEVVYLSQDRTKELDRHPACFIHGLNEVERHHQAGGTAPAELREQGQ